MIAKEVCISVCMLYLFHGTACFLYEDHRSDNYTVERMRDQARVLQRICKSIPFHSSLFNKLCPLGDYNSNESMKGAPSEPQISSRLQPQPGMLGRLVRAGMYTIQGGTYGDKRGPKLQGNVIQAGRPERILMVPPFITEV